MYDRALAPPPSLPHFLDGYFFKHFTIHITYRNLLYILLSIFYVRHTDLSETSAVLLFALFDPTYFLKVFFDKPDSFRQFLVRFVAGRAIRFSAVK